MEVTRIFLRHLVNLNEGMGSGERAARKGQSAETGLERKGKPLGNFSMLPLVVK